MKILFDEDRRGRLEELQLSASAGYQNNNKIDAEAKCRLSTAANLLIVCEVELNESPTTVV